MKLNLIEISIFTLAISVIVGSFIIENAINTEHNLKISTSNQKGEEPLQKQLLTKEEASEFLGISVEEFDEIDKNEFAAFGCGIPYVESNNTKYYTIQSIGMWLTEINSYNE